ncbi:MAG TPA: DUF2142 domain-containing protein [Saprospiraceae bacterium]|nr:DUF2142 domain-containing protein [Saprospiraceae bacterium]
MHPQPKRFFTAVALIFGILYALLIPPGHVPDEPNHFFRAYQISQGHWRTKSVNHRLGDTLPVSVIQVFEPFRKLRYHYDQKITQKDFEKVFYLELEPNRVRFQDFPNTAIYSPIGYAPQILSIWVASKLKLRPLFIFYLTRFFGLFVWIGMIRLAIDWIPFGKWIWCILALLPASLSINAGITADMMTNGVSFLLIAWLLKTAFGPPTIPKKAWIYPIGLSAILAATKIVYTPIFLLAFLIPRAHFRHLLSFSPKINKRIFIGIGLATNLFIISIIYHNSKAQFIPYKDYNPAFREGQQINEGADPGQQLDYVIHHPLAFAKTTLSSYAGSLKATLAHYFGKFGWEKNYLPGWLIALLLIATIGMGLSNDAQALTPTQRLFLVAVGLLMMLGFATVIYIQWSPVGSNRILSLAGRYMFPIFPLFYLALPPIWRKPRQQRRTLTLAQVTLLMSLCVGIWEMIARYYFGTSV